MSQLNNPLDVPLEVLDTPALRQRVNLLKQIQADANRAIVATNREIKRRNREDYYETLGQ